MAIPFRTCFEYLAERWSDELVVTSAGNTGQMWWDITRNAEQVFYLDASMSLSTMFASGLAIGVPERQVWAFMGDGAFCMNPGMLMVERDLNLPNLTHFLVSNRVYGATSNAPLPNQVANDYAAVARSMGLSRVFTFESLDELDAGFEAIARPNKDGHTFVVLEVEPITGPDAKLEVMPIDGPEMKFRFGRYVERTTGKRIFSDQI